MKNLVYVIVFAACCFLFFGCASSGITASAHITNVQLGSPNFKVIATNVSGEASSRGIIGISFGLGMGATQLSLIPLTEDRMLYRRAVKDLWAKFETANGTTVNRKLALVNVRYDSESLNLLLYTRVTTAIVADVVEFQ
jgi:hypothetical protein